MSLEEVWHRAGEGWSEAVTEFHIVGGLHPELTLDWYCEMLRGLKERFPQVHLKAFTMVEIAYLARRAKTVACAKAGSCATPAWIPLPGGGAEIFNERVRRIICDHKIDGDEWLEAARDGASSGLAFELHHALRPHRERRGSRRSPGEAARSAGRDPRLRDLHPAGVSSRQHAAAAHSEDHRIRRHPKKSRWRA